MLRNSTPLKWTPGGVSDTQDGTNTFPGAMNALTNLIPDRSTKGLWVCRPASQLRSAFEGFLNATFTSGYIIVGTRAYGLVATTLNAGHDEPFCYDLQTSAFVTVTGVVAGNVPVSPPAFGDWVPPRFAIIGTKIVVTHPGYVGSANFFGWFDVSNPAIPTWNAGNVATNPLAAVPVDVFNFFGRAYYAVNTPTISALVFSDILDPLTCTTGTQVLTLDDNVPVTALGGLPLSSTQGAVIATLVAFKGVSSIYFIAGDAATNDLSKNKVSAATGTLAPNSITSTSVGLAFVSPEGLRMVELTGTISDPVGADGAGVTVPFIYSLHPSRICAACNGDTLRIATQNGNALGAPNQEYWYDLTRKNWSGPHSFAASLIKGYSNTFVKTAVGVDGKLFQSDAQQQLTSLYVENGTAMSFAFITAMLPDIDQMCENSVVETTVDLAYTPGTPSYTAVIGDQNGIIFDTLSLSTTGNATLWGQFNWGQAQWLGTLNSLAPRNFGWHEPIVFRRAFIGINGQASGTAKFGSIRMRYERLGYLQQELGGFT